MMDHPRFWYGLQAFLLLLYISALILVLQGSGLHFLVVLAGLLLFVHLCELPYAIRLLKQRDASLPLIVLATLLFGWAWWHPVNRGILPS